MGFWNWVNIDTIIITVVVVAVLYCFFTSKRKKHMFRGLGSSGFDFQEANWYIPLRRRKIKKKKVYKNEERCREIFQNIFQVPFKKIRPDWLKSPATGKNLEIDGYNAHIRTPIGKGLGFEYNGRQHSKYTPYFHRRGPKEFHYQVAKDDWKNVKCKEKGVTIVNIPYDVAPPDLERFINYRLKKLGAHPDSHQKSGKSNPRLRISPFNIYH